MCWASQFFAQLISSQPTGTCWSSSTTQNLPMILIIFMMILMIIILVVLHLVLHAGKVGDGTEPLLLVLEMQVHVVLQDLQLVGIVGVLRHSEDVSKEYVVLLVDPRVVGGKGLVPDIRLRHLVLQVTLVAC